MPVAIRKLQVAVLARSSIEISQTYLLVAYAITSKGIITPLLIQCCLYIIPVSKPMLHAGESNNHITVDF